MPVALCNVKPIHPTASHAVVTSNANIYCGDSEVEIFMWRTASDIYKQDVGTEVYIKSCWRVANEIVLRTFRPGCGNPMETNYDESNTIFNPSRAPLHPRLAHPPPEYPP